MCQAAATIPIPNRIHEALLNGETSNGRLVGKSPHKKSLKRNSGVSTNAFVQTKNQMVECVLKIFLATWQVFSKNYPSFSPNICAKQYAKCYKNSLRN